MKEVSGRRHVEMEKKAPAVAARARCRWASWWLGLALMAALLAALLALRSADAAVKKEEFPVATLSANQLAPAMSGEIVVWEDKRDDLSNIYGKDLANDQEFLVASGSSAKRKPVTNGKVVIWEDRRGGDADIYGYEIPADLSMPGREFVVASGPGDQRKPAISGSRVVWQDDRSGSWEIFGYDLAAKREFMVATGDGNRANPAISGDTVAWQDDRNVTGNSDIYAKNLATGNVFAVGTGESFEDMPAISGGIVVWRQRNAGSYDIFGRDLYAGAIESGEVFQVTTDPNDQVAPSISGKIVVWQDHRNGNADIYGKDLSTGKGFQITEDNGPQESPMIHGEKVVWESQRVGDTNFGTYDIYGASLDTAPAAPGDLRATGSSDGITLEWTANAEEDLAGYNVYRSDSSDGTYARLNAALLPKDSPSYSDADAPKGSVSHYRVTAVDAAGNESAPARVSSSAHATTDISLETSPSILKYGKSTTLSGKLTSEGAVLPGRPVILEQKPAGASDFGLVPDGKLATAPDGTFRLGGVKPTRNTLYRARFAGHPKTGLQASTSLTKRVKVKAKISLNKPKRSPRSRVEISGKAIAAKTGSVKVTIKRGGKVVANKSVRLNNSRFRFAYKPARAGRYTVKARVPKSATHLANASGNKFFRTGR